MSQSEKVTPINRRAAAKREIAQQAQKRAEKALLEVASNNNALTILLAAVLEFHHSGDTVLPQSLLKEIEGRANFGGVECEEKNGQVHLRIAAEVTPQ